MPNPTHFFGKTPTEIALNAFNFLLLSTMAMIPASAVITSNMLDIKKACHALKNGEISVHTFFIQMVENDEASANKLVPQALILALKVAEVVGKKPLPAEAKEILKLLETKKINSLAEIKTYLDKKIIPQHPSTPPRSKL